MDVVWAKVYRGPVVEDRVVAVEAVHHHKVAMPDMLGGVRAWVLEVSLSHWDKCRSIKPVSWEPAGE
uniref:Uncharacterized protein n=1 Tax=Cannabis sativa TaxID=3483 RepID=A0A803QIK6_CANSA